MFDSYSSARRVLRHTLRANAAFSVLSGLVMIGFGGEIAGLLGAVDPELIRLVGGAVVVFGVGVGWMSLGQVHTRDAQLVSSLDGAWVVGSALVLLAYPAVFSPLGWWLVLGVAVLVADFALFQLLAARGMRRHGDARAA